ncbi:mannose-6-phosphate isomerase [Jaminaea rosea]|uniref:Mannose-6-phosphate isomerase n=1 Tax=Jaminaea rosea TaxID=1569628 RepID=A0A316UZ44_9BASI|nr:mannose-6-phosphate isomerase [Jaminaea rosea]PWN30482.1 mannose-6-phosphate isomerase [Jaminaea rosea]
MSSPSAASGSGTSNGDGGANGKIEQYGPAGPFGAVFQIIPGVQNYDWGIEGKKGSLVAVYGEATEQLGMKIEDDKPYAELWMGTHPTLPSTIVPPPNCPRPPPSGTFISLSSYLNRHSSLLGDKVVKKYGDGLTRNGGVDGPDGKKKDQGALPFLFKILSAGKALSIQAHPDKDLAKRLHAEKPKSYKDDNHKPEMAIALTPFRGFCGFRPLGEIVHFLSVVPEFHALVDPSDAFLSEVEYASKPTSGTTEQETKQWLRKIFEPLMKAKMTDVKKRTMGIAQRYASALASGSAKDLEVDESLAKLVCTLNEQFPGDVGVFCSFVLNVVRMQPGQAMFLKANEPHAYIEGNIVECMAASDNVVRAGLTPKERDVDVLVDMLTYSSGGPDKQLMKPRPWLPAKGSKTREAYGVAAEGKEDDDEAIAAVELPLDVASPSAAKRDEPLASLPSLLYDPPIDEFSVAVTRLRPGQAEKQRAVQGPSLLILTAGKGKLRTVSAEGEDQREFDMDKPGKVFFVGAGQEVEISADESGDEGAAAGSLSVFRAFVEVAE